MYFVLLGYYYGSILGIISRVMDIQGRKLLSTAENINKKEFKNTKYKEIVEVALVQQKFLSRLISRFLISSLSSMPGHKSKAL